MHGFQLISLDFQRSHNGDINTESHRNNELINLFKRLHILHINLYMPILMISPYEGVPRLPNMALTLRYLSNLNNNNNTKSVLIQDHHCHRLRF